MTHGDLLDKIYWHWRNANDAEFFGLSGYRKSLRAVVELHTPFIYTNYKNQELPFCSECTGVNGEDYWVEYPCPTIQAIEKELI